MKKSVEDRLPPFSATKNPITGETVLIKRGERGYFPCNTSKPITAEEYNKTQNITPAQVDAMLIGSMFGFNVDGVEKALNQ